ncbi:MAG: alkylphosphonate utilization protein [Bdellovibrionales bacterium]|nr:alkylphosphonate utilization protein [Bdellovibrionales bacterium]
MSRTEPNCPNCDASHSYHDGSLWICPLCHHEWTEASMAAEGTGGAPEDQSPLVKDAHGTVLQEGDSVIVVKDLPVKGASGPIKAGTKIKSIRIAHDVPGHNIVCKIDGFGQIHLKSQYVKKS